MTYKIQIDDEIRDATPEEIVAIEQHEGNLEKAMQAATAAKASARTKLKALGLTDAEVAALLG